MGAKQSKRSVDITTTPKKEGESPVEGEGRLEKITDDDIKVTTNGTVHTEIEFADKDESPKEEMEGGAKEEKDVNEASNKGENGIASTEGTEKVPESGGDAPEQQQQTSEPSTPIEKSNETTEKLEENGDSSKKNKEKTKKKKWSFRSISFSKKEKPKSSNKEAEKNGEVKEVVAEEGTEEAVASPTDAKETKKESEEVPVEKSAVNGDSASSEGIQKSESKETSENVPIKEEPKSINDSTKVEKIEEKEAAEKALPVEAPKPPVEEPKVPVEEPKPVEPVVEETKEVRSEETPPPLPSSNPPSSVTVFAESTMAEVVPIVSESCALPTCEISPSSPIKETLVETSSVSNPASEITSSVSLTDQKNETNEQEKIIPTISSEIVNIIAVESIKVSPIVDLSQDLPKSDIISSLNEQVDKINEVIKQSVLVDENLVATPTESKNVIENSIETSSVENKKTEETVTEEKKDEVILEEKKSELEILSTSQPEILPNPPTLLENVVLSTPPPSPIIKDVVESIKPSESPVPKSDSLPDISTESLPSLPEPISECLPEPMSLPPLDAVPEPITLDENSLVTNNVVDSKPCSQNEAVVMNGMNGNTEHNESSPENDVPSSIDRPLKQVIKDVDPIIISNEIGQGDRQNDVAVTENQVSTTVTTAEE